MFLVLKHIVNLTSHILTVILLISSHNSLWIYTTTGAASPNHHNQTHIPSVSRSPTTVALANQDWILLSVGQDEFHSEAVDTLNYVVNQSDYTVQTLVNITGYLALEKTVNVAQFYLPSDVKDSIEKLNVYLNKASDTLGRKTHQNSLKIRNVFDAV
ncbi:ion transport domain-containing protein [Tanacetum coccineum]|uniref:Ion transport domain-containing protein n=1 Tax=Tanacetum coccineum TaxID=301880 RepID=A0ABQ4YXA6_9ASTR